MSALIKRLAPLNRKRGFTLIELIMVIILLGIVSTMVSVFMKNPIDAYLASIRRAELSDTADTVVRRMARDIRTAVPNSVRVSPDRQCLEFIPTKTGARYRAAPDVAGNGDTMDFDTADTSFNMLGNNLSQPVGQRIGIGDVVVVYNLGITGADAYLGDNVSAVIAVSPSSSGPDETRIGINPKKFPLASGTNRFQVIPREEKIVAYVCSVGDLRRTASTDFSSSCAATGPVMAQGVSACNFDYSGSDLQRNALARIVLQLTQANETVSLLHEIHINNTP